MSKQVKKKKSTVRRLVVANLLALLTFLTVTVVTLWALGLLPSILAFVF